MSALSAKINSDWQMVSSIDPITEWEDIKVGKTYHVPPIYIYKRMEVTFEDKDERSAHVTIKQDGRITHRILYRSEIIARYLTEILRFPTKQLRF